MPEMPTSRTLAEMNDCDSGTPRVANMLLRSRNPEMSVSATPITKTVDVSSGSSPVIAAFHGSDKH